MILRQIFIFREDQINLCFFAYDINNTGFINRSYKICWHVINCLGRICLVFSKTVW